MLLYMQESSLLVDSDHPERIGHLLVCAHYACTSTMISALTIGQNDFDRVKGGTPG